MAKIMPHGSNDLLREGADEVRAKLKQDLSRWTRARRFVTMNPTIACQECDGTCHTVCQGCDGTGKARLIFGDDPQACPTCAGTGEVTCATCAGRGQVENVHRKKLKMILIVGGIAWALVLLRLWALDHDILPGFRAQGGGAPLQNGGGRVMRPRGGGMDGVPRGGAIGGR